MIAVETKNLTKNFKILIKRPGLKGVFQSFFEKKYKTVEAVRCLNFQIEKGELVGFLGPNGAGKTTTLKLLAGLLYPTSGSISALGFSPAKRGRAFQKKFAMVMGQRTQLWWDLPARETFALNQKIYEIPDPQFQRRQQELIELLELQDLIEIPVKKLSLGERMKAELACALLHEPELLLLDEPTLGLDLVMQKKLRAFILDYNRRTRSTILLTSHNMNDVEELCQRVMIINNGQLLYDGNLEKIVEHYAPAKLVTLTSSNPLNPENLMRYGRLIVCNHASAKIEVPRKEVSKAIESIFASAKIVDLSIEELPIEEIIRRVFAKDPSLQSEFFTEPADSSRRFESNPKEP